MKVFEYMKERETLMKVKVIIFIICFLLFLVIRRIWTWSLVNIVNNKKCFIFWHLFQFYQCHVCHWLLKNDLKFTEMM